MRRPFTRAEAEQRGISIATLRWGLKTGKWQRIAHGVYVEGAAPATPLERAVGVVIGTGGVASHSLAGVLHGLDGVRLAKPFATVPVGVRSLRAGVRARTLPIGSITDVDGVRCTDGMQTLIDLAAVVDDLVWEQALESALRMRLASVPNLQNELPRLGAMRTSGVRRIRRVLASRPTGAPPTDSLLETLMIQLIRAHSTLPEPERQVEVYNRGVFVARVDLAWPGAGVFVELDGHHHLDQPVHDARRETAVIAATGWLPARFTWTEVTRVPASTARRVAEIYELAGRRSYATAV